MAKLLLPGDASVTRITHKLNELRLKKIFANNLNFHSLLTSHQRWRSYHQRTSKELSNLLCNNFRNIRFNRQKNMPKTDALCFNFKKTYTENCSLS